MKIIEVTNEKQPVSARVNKYIYEEYKKAEIPISSVIEASLINFLKLTNEQRILFLSDNLPENVEKDEIKTDEVKWTSFLKESLKTLKIPAAVAGTMIAGPIVGPIALIAGGLVLGKKLFDKSKDDKNIKDY